MRQPSGSWVESHISWLIQGLILCSGDTVADHQPAGVAHRSSPRRLAPTARWRGSWQDRSRSTLGSCCWHLHADWHLCTRAVWHLSLPVVRIGGGLLVASTAWRMLHHTEEEDDVAGAVEEAEVPQAEASCMRLRRAYRPLQERDRRACALRLCRGRHRPSRARPQRSANAGDT